jgi:hypothetical protein
MRDVVTLAGREVVNGDHLRASGPERGAEM